MVDNAHVVYTTRMTDFVQAGERELQLEAIGRLRVLAEVTRHQAEAIRFAFEVGIPKQRIHELTGRSRSAINQTLARETQRARPLCQYCVQEHFEAARNGKNARPIKEASGYLIYRIGDRPEIVAQRLCATHIEEDWERQLPSSARAVVTPHMPNVPSRIVYSLGGLRDDKDLYQSYFGSGDFPEWEAIRALLD
jgi:hypothetical protein